MHWLIRGGSALHMGGSRLSKTDPLRSSAGFGGFLRSSWGTFPRIVLIHYEWKHPERGKEKKEGGCLSLSHSATLAPNLCWDSLQWERKAHTHTEHKLWWQLLTFHGGWTVSSVWAAPNFKHWRCFESLWCSMILMTLWTISDPFIRQFFNTKHRRGYLKRKYLLCNDKNEQEDSIEVFAE